MTPAKLGNFLEIECWVLVACGENSLVEAHKEFMKPIITPWELEVALGERDWITALNKGEGYTLDFERVLRRSQDKKTERETEDEQNCVADEEIIDPEGPVFSTVTGAYRYRRTYGNKNVDNGTFSFLFVFN